MSQTLYIIPLESVQGRYTIQWREHIPAEFIKAGFKVEVIDGEQSNQVIETGTFLDIHTTIHYKNSQIQLVAGLFASKKINDGDAFLFYDGEFWGGVESVRLLSQMNKINVKIYAFFHAASYTIEDAFSIAHKHQKYIELGWLSACDKIFVGSAYHKQAIVDRRIVPLADPLDREELINKIVVTGNPFFKSDYDITKVVKKNQIILPNRFDWEKRPNLSLDFAYILKRSLPDINIVVTTSQPELTSNRNWLITMAREMENDGIIDIRANLSKPEYHAIIEESKIMMSNSIEENFGICIMEAMIYNTAPLLRNHLSHPELVNNDKRFLFNDEDEIIDKVKHLLSGKDDTNLTNVMQTQVDWYYQSTNRIIDLIKGAR